MELKFFYGTSNPQLGEKIVEMLGIEKGQILLKKFANGETYVQFLENVRAKDVFLLQTSVEPINDALVELLIMIDAAKRSSAGRITAVIPNYFYARQDRKAASREPITAKLVADLITAAGADRVLTLDLHSEQLQGFFNIPLDNLPARTIMIRKAKEVSENYVVVAPDEGSVKAATKMALKMNCGLAIINKLRCEHNKCEALNIIGENVVEKDALIFDDMIDTGGTVISSAQILKKEGCKRVFVFATHGIFSSNAVERINNSEIDGVFVTDSLPQKNAKGKIHLVSVAKYIADAIKCINEEKSVSLLFESP